MLGTTVCIESAQGCDNHLINKFSPLQEASVCFTTSTFHGRHWGEQEVVHHHHSQKMLEELGKPGPLDHSCHQSSPSFQTHPRDHSSL